MTHTKKTLSIAYFPDDDFRCGWKKITRLVGGDRRLRQLISSPRKTITPKEVQIIYSLLGTP